MEREKNERLTAKKIEEEEMKRKLTDIGIYEPDLTYKQMKTLLGFINESQDTSNIACNNKDTHKGQHANNQHLSEIASDVNASQEMALQECAEISRSSYSYRLNHTSPTVPEHKIGHYVNSLDSSPSFEVRKPMYRRKSSDSDEMFESTNSTHSTNRSLSLRSTNTPRECQNATDKKTAQDTQGEFVQRLERWRLNPLDVCINENDVPLQLPNRSSAGEHMQYLSGCKKTHTSEQRDQAIRIMSQHLKEIADLWYSWHPAANSIFQWGSPIQVGTANGSLDKKPLTEPKTEQIKTECTYRDNHERVSKRKANSLIASLTKDSSTEDEEDKWHDVFRGKKKRVESDSKSSNVQRAMNQHAHNDSHEKATSSVRARQENSTNDNDSNIDFDNEHIKSVHSKKTDEKNENVPKELNTYPRRIVPPNPRARLNLPRLRKGTAKTEGKSKTSPKMRRINENKLIEQAKKQKDKLTDKEINRLIEDWNSDKEEDAVKRNVEMRPLPITKEIQSKLHEKRLSLHSMETVKKTRATTKEEESDGEQKKDKRPKLCEQRKKEELCRIKNGNSWEHQLMSDDEDTLPETNQELDVQNDNYSDNVITSTNNVSCPICNKLFSHSEIENHAADCEQFETNNEDDVNDTDKFNCNICSNYKTSNGMEYEEHVRQCIERCEKKHSPGSEDIDTAPASSFHTYKRIIDEQKDSEIAYLGQFSSDNKTKINTNRKRKLFTKNND